MSQLQAVTPIVGTALVISTTVIGIVTKKDPLKDPAQKLVISSVSPVL